MAAKKKAQRRKKYFTVAQANATLPLIRVIVRDITEQAASFTDLRDRLEPILSENYVTMSEAHREELQQVQVEIERYRTRMVEYEQELNNLGVILKDHRAGLIDFPSWLESREVYLCWRLDEPEVAYWHEIDAGFAGRQRLMADAARS
jgi:hypothetical protein